MSQLEVLRSRIKRYNPFLRSRELGLSFKPNIISIRLFGVLGHGKSALINNFFHVFNDAEYENIAGEESPERSLGGGETKSLHCYPLPNTCMEIVDNRGCNEFKFSEQTEFRSQIEGKRQLNTDISFESDFMAFFKWAKSYFSPWSWSEWYFNESKSDDTIIVPVLVLRASCTLDKKMLSNLHNFCTSVAYRYTGVYPLIVLTFGQERPEWEGRHIYPELPCRKFLLNNYHQRLSERNARTDRMILEILNACIDCADQVLMKCAGLAHKPIIFQ